MKTLRETIEEFHSNNKAIGHFNVSNIEMIRAVAGAVRATNLPVIIGVSEGERDVFGVSEIVAIVRIMREVHGLPVYLNADHTYSVERVREAIDAGFDSVVFDGARLSLEENIAKTKECVVYAREKGGTTLIEGELGFIGAGSQLLDAIPEGAAVTEDLMTSTHEAKHFVEETGVELLAPAVGTVHGMMKSGNNPRINSERIREIASVVDIPLVLHGGSGTSEDEYREAIVNGIAQVHVSTELRVAYKRSLQLSLQENPEELAPYKYTKQAILSVQDIIEQRMRLFAGLA
jgi:fructose-bisphosphate aldolase class II